MKRLPCPVYAIPEPKLPSRSLGVDDPSGVARPEVSRAVPGGLALPMRGTPAGALAAMAALASRPAIRVGVIQGMMTAGGRSGKPETLQVHATDGRLWSARSPRKHTEEALNVRIRPHVPI